MLKNWLIAISIIPCWSFCNVFYRYASLKYDVNTLIFTSSVMLSGAVSLLLISGKGALVLETIKDKNTWVWGICQVLSNIVLIALFTIVTSTEGALMTRISVLAALVISYFYAQRTPSKHDIVSVLLIVISVSMVAANLPLDVRSQAITLVIFAGIIQAIRIYSAESHKQNNIAIKTKDKARITGLVLGITSIMFMALAFVGMLAREYSNLDIAILKSMPTQHDFSNSMTIFLSVPVGLIIVGYMKYAEFHAAKHVKSENLLVLTALVPLVTYLFEVIGSTLSPEILTVRDLSETDLLAGIIMTFGVFYAAYFNAKKSK